MADLQRAIEIAVEAHKETVQKNGLPYVLHPLSVMMNVASEKAKIAAVLHDVIEDSNNWELEDIRSEGFSKAVVEAVDCLTHREGEEYWDYIKRVSSNRIATEVKLADLKDNMDIRRIPDLKDEDFERIEKYHKAWQYLGGNDF